MVLIAGRLGRPDRMARSCGTGPRRIRSGPVISGDFILREVVPGINLVAVLWKPDSMPDRAREVRLKEANVSAQALRVQLQVVEALGPADLDKAFLDISAKGASALVVLTTPIFGIERQRIADLAAKNRLPTVYGSRNYVEHAGLMSYA